MEALRGFFAFARAFGERLVRWSLFDRPAEPEQEAEPVGGDFDSGSEDPPSPRLPAPSAPPAEPNVQATAEECRGAPRFENGPAQHRGPHYVVWVVPGRPDLTGVHSGHSAWANLSRQFPPGGYCYARGYRLRGWNESVVPRRRLTQDEAFDLFENERSRHGCGAVRHHRWP